MFRHLIEQYLYIVVCTVFFTHSCVKGPAGTLCRWDGGTWCWGVQEVDTTSAFPPGHSRQGHCTWAQARQPCPGQTWCSFSATLEKYVELRRGLFFFLTPSCLDDVSEENCTGQKQGLSSLLCIKPFSSGNNNSNALFLHNLPEFIHKILLRTSVYFIYINLGLLHLSSHPRRQMLFPRIRRKKKN